MSHANYDYVKRNEFGDEFSYKSGTGKKSRWIGTRMCLGKREERVFSGDNREALEAWADWAHECERDAPPKEPTPVVPLGYRTKEEDLARGPLITEEVKADVAELLECGDMAQAEITDAFGISQSAVSSINKELSERRKRHEERQAVREEERRLRSEEREREKPEPLPDNFKPRAHGRQSFYMIAPKESERTLFANRATAERVLSCIYENTDRWNVPLEVIECKFWDEG